MAVRLLHHSTLGLRVKKKKKRSAKPNEAELGFLPMSTVALCHQCIQGYLAHKKPPPRRTLP